MPTTTYKYFAQVADGIDRNTISKIEAPTIEGVINGAWQLQRYHEAPITIWDSEDEETGKPRKLGVLNLEWLDD